MADVVVEKVKNICKNKKNTNIIQEHLIKLENDNESDVIESIQILKGVFSFYTKKGICKEVELDQQNNDVDSSSNNAANNVVNDWLYASYKAFLQILLDLISSEYTSIQVESLDTLMNMLQVQHSYLIKSQKQNPEMPIKLYYPNQFFIKIVNKLMHCDNLSTELMESITNLVDFDDNRYYFLKNIHSLIQQRQSAASEQIRYKVVGNTHSILSLISKYDESEECENLFIPQLNAEELAFDTSEISKSYKNVFSSAWLSLLRIPNLSIVIQKKTLIDLDTKILPKLIDPKLLIDFLTDTYNIGGVLSLLSLNSLFVLINQYNLDYPDFYQKLYNLLEPSIFNVKYTARFFHLLDLFLSSSHLPGYLVAAFIKRLSRICLFTPSPDLEMLLVFIRNLLIRHPSSRILVHRKNSKDQDTVKNIKSDPFIYEETDPSKCQALKSCLWELTTLKSHYSSDVLKVVASFNKEFPKLETDVREYFDKSYEDLFQAKLKENVDNIPPLNFMKDTEVFKDIDSEMWVLE